MCYVEIAHMHSVRMADLFSGQMCYVEIAQLHSAKMAELVNAQMCYVEIAQLCPNYQFSTVVL